MKTSTHFTSSVCTGLLLACLSTAGPSLADAPCEPNVTGTGRYEYDPGTKLLPLPIQAGLALIEQCGAANVEWLGIQVSAGFTSGSNRADFDIQYDGMAALNQTISSMGHLWDLVVPEFSIENCPPIRGEKPILGIRGTVDLYSFHVGSAGYFKQEIEGELTACDTIRVRSPVATTLEVPVRIRGCITVAESFGQQPITSALGRLELSGVMAEQVIGPFVLELESVSVIPRQACIDETVTIAINVDAGITEFDFSILGSYLATAGAKGTGFFGSIAGSSTVVISFPNSIEVGNFRGASGEALHPGVVVESAINGMVYNSGEDTCSQDLNGDGILDFFDVQLFLNLYTASDPAADFTNDGELDFFDVQAFLGLFAAGCP